MLLLFHRCRCLAWAQKHLTFHSGFSDIRGAHQSFAAIFAPRCRWIPLVRRTLWAALGSGCGPTAHLLLRVGRTEKQKNLVNYIINLITYIISYRWVAR